MPRSKAAKMHVEQRWAADGRSSWCVIENGLAYGFGYGPRMTVRDQICGLDAIMRRAKRSGGMARTYSPTSDFRLKSPPGTNEEEWLRQNDTRYEQTEEEPCPRRTRR